MIRVTGTIVPTSPLDDFATHEAQYGKGGYRSVADAAARDAITTERREAGMMVITLDTGQKWILQNDLTTWMLETISSALTLTGDVTGSGTNSIATTLINSGVTAGIYGSASQIAQYTVDLKGRITLAANVPVQISEAQVTNLVADLALKVNNSALGVTVAQLVAGTVPVGQLPFSSTAYLGLWNASTNTPTLSDGTGTAGQFVIVNVAATRNLGSGNVNWLLGYVAVHNGTIWQQSNLFTGTSVQTIITDSGTLTGSTVTINSTAQIADSTNRRYVTDAIRAGLVNAATTPSAVNPFLTAADINFSIINYKNTWNAATNTPTLTNGVGTAGDGYIVGTGGTVNFGAGNISFLPGDVVILSSTLIWQKVPAVSAGVMSINGFTGVVVIDADDIAESATRFYMNANWRAAAAASNGPTGANPFATMADVTFSPLNYQNSWNASTNFPALADGVGTAGQAYIVGVPGTRNLGSGAITFAIGDLVVYNASNVWQKITGAAPGVSSWNGLTGAVNATTANLPVSTDKNYVTDAQSAALGGTPFPPTASNYYLTKAEVPNISLGNQWFTPESVTPSGYPTLGTGVAQTFTSAGKTLGQAQADFPLAPITSVNDLIDWAASYQAMKLTENTARQNRIDWGLYGARKYMVNKPIYVPSTTSKGQLDAWVFEGNGSMIQSTTTANIFESVPSTQTIADTWIGRELSFRNFKIYGSSASKGSGQTGVRIGASVMTRFDKVEVNQCDNSWDLLFCLFAGFIQCRSTNATSNGFWIHTGLDINGNPVWTGAALANSASNDVFMLGSRGFVALGSDYGTLLQGVSDVRMIKYTSEGAESGTQSNQPKAAIFYDDLNSTVCKGFNVEGVHAEQSYTDSIIKIKARAGQFHLNDIYNQKQGIYASANRDIVNAESYAGVCQVNYTNARYATPFQQFRVTNKPYVRMAFTDSELTGMPLQNGTVTDLRNNTAMWSNQIPDYMRITPLL